MKKLILLFVIATPLISQAQIGGLLKKTRDKVNEKLGNKVEKEIDKSLGPDTEKSKKGPGKAGNEIPFLISREAQQVHSVDVFCFFILSFILYCFVFSTSRLLP